MIKIVLTAIVIILLAVLLKSHKNEYGIYITIAGSLLLLFISVNRFSGIISVIKKIYSEISVDNTYMVILFKMIGIAFISEFTSGICKDAGFISVAYLVEFIGKLSILLTGAPIIQALLDTIFSSGLIR